MNFSFPYRPSFMHFWQLKSYWRELKVGWVCLFYTSNDRIRPQICDEDIEFHTYEEICTEPALVIKEVTDEDIKLVCDEMAAFRKYFESALLASKGNNDLENFWLRKSKKPVLAVLLVQKGNEKKLYRGRDVAALW